mgnify:FL=1
MSEKRSRETYTIDFIWKGERRMFSRVRLNTLHMYDSTDPDERDYQLHKKIAEFMNGEVAIVSNAIDGSEDYRLLFLVDPKKDMELAYMMEQDSRTGCFINNREDFEKVYASGEYSRDVCLVLKPETVVILPF